MLTPRQMFDDNVRPADLLLRVKRRNDIVHRADRAQDDPSGPAQEIGFAWTRQAVDTIRVVCLGLDELVAERMSELRRQAEELEPQGVA